MTNPTPGRLAYLAQLTDDELHNALRSNENAVRNSIGLADYEVAQDDREDLLAEMLRRPAFDPRSSEFRKDLR